MENIGKLSPGNSFGQTPLHFLASTKKVKLLMTYLDKIYSVPESDLMMSLSLTGFDPKKSDSTHRSFMHILLDKGLISTFEAICKKYLT